MTINNMNIKNMFSSLVKKLFSDWKNIFLLLLAIALIVLGILYRRSEKKIEFMNAQNIELQDTLIEYKNKAGELYTAKETYITTIKDLKQLNSDLSAEVKKLKDNPIVVTKVEYETKVETIYIKDSLEFSDDLKTYKSIFDYQDKWTSIDGFTYFDFRNMDSYTTINNISFTGNFYYDIIEKDNKLYTAVRSDSPYLQINNIETAIISPNNSKILRQHFRRPWGISGGIGVSAVVVNNTVKIVPSVSVIVGYKFIDF